MLALKMRCCGRYYACRECHDAVAGHEAQVWPLAEQGALATMCGVCGHEQTARAYLQDSRRCPACGAGFNPGCAKHRHLYFETAAPGPA